MYSVYQGLGPTTEGHVVKRTTARKVAGQVFQQRRFSGSSRQTDTLDPVRLAHDCREHIFIRLLCRSHAPRVNLYDVRFD